MQTKLIAADILNVPVINSSREGLPTSVIFAKFLFQWEISTHNVFRWSVTLTPHKKKKSEKCIGLFKCINIIVILIRII